MKKTILITVAVLLVIFALFYIIDSRPAKDEQKNGNNFVECLVDAGMVVYGSKTCPACMNLVEKFGGYDEMGDLFVSCGDDGDRCEKEMQTNYVPVIQINGELFEDGRELEDFAKATGCEL